MRNQLQLFTPKTVLHTDFSVFSLNCVFGMHSSYYFIFLSYVRLKLLISVSLMPGHGFNI